MPESLPDGSPTTLESIYRAHQGLVRWVLRARGVPESSLDDQVHDTFIAIDRRLSERDPAVPLRTWIAGVARNVGFTHRRSVARRRRRTEGLMVPDEPRRPDEELERREAWRALQDFLDELRPNQREVFVMVELSGMRVSELATSMGTPPNTLHSRLLAARKQFNRRFAAVDDRGALVRRATTQGRARTEQRQRTWALIAASTEGLGVLPGPIVAASAAGGGTGSVKLFAATVVVGLLGVTGLVAATQPEPAPEPSRSRDAAGPRPSATSGSTATRGAAVVADARTETVPTPASRTARVDPAIDSARRTSSAERPSAHPPHPRREPTVASPRRDTVSAELEDPLASTLAILRRARGSLARARPAEALALLAELDDLGEFERERRRLELDGACQLDDRARARRSAVTLARLGATVDIDHPCGTDDD